MTPSFIPIDQAERDAIARDVSVNMCVEAGAGTGKTTVLVNRIVNIVGSGHATIDQMAVITFTEKAAAELSSRVRKALEETLDQGDDDARARIEAALLGLNHAHIETIHAFASSMLRERPVEAGLDPGFEVLDTLPSQLEFEAAYSEWIGGEMAKDPPPSALLEALDLELDFQHVREAAEALHWHRQLLPLAGYDSKDADLARVLDAIASEGVLLADIATRVRNEEDAGYQQIKGWLLYEIDALRAVRERPTALRRAIINFPKVNGNAGAQPNWLNPQDTRAMKDAFKRINNIVLDARETMRAKATSDLLMWLQGFVHAYASGRKRAGKADFDDLLIWARDLLRDRPEVRAYYRDRYRCILVDEFQDTDPLQVEMIVYLCAEDSPDDWRDARLRPGSLFVVGDPKQSIYRFRNADITMYDDVKQRIFGGEPRRITQNFRSARPIIEWANAIFSRMITPAHGVQPPYVDLAHHPLLETDDAVTVIQGKTPPYNGQVNATAFRRYEGERLASMIAQHVSAGAWTVRAGDGDQRPAKYRDIVLLIPSRTDLQFYEDAFARAGVPYRHEGGRTFFLRQEVRELIMVLRSIDDPGDAIAAIGALRSAAFACSDEDLLAHRAQGKFDYRTLPKDATGYTADCLRRLDDLSRLRYTLTLPELIRAVLDRTRLVEFAMLQPHGDQVAANLLKVIDQARAFTEASGRGLRSFVRWLKLNLDRTTDETDAAISEETDDVVRIVTIHAAKGLEFPIVVFANMNTTRADRTNTIADRVAKRLHVKLGKRENGFRTPGYDGAELNEKLHRLAEERRLLYVAATRARDRLVVPFVRLRGTAPEPETYNEWLLDAGALPEHPLDADAYPAVMGDLPVWRGSFVNGDQHADAERVVEERDAWVREHTALIERAATPLLVQTASALKPEWERPALAGDDVRRTRASEFGSAVHALLERTPIDADDVSATLARSIAAEFAQQGREAEMMAVAGRALASDVMARARRSQRVLHEAPFVAGLPGGAGVAEGRIDLLFEEDGELVIVDFKTDAVRPGEVDARAEHYRNQALVYAWAAASATGMRIREVVFIFANPGVERSFSVDEAMLAEAGELLKTQPAVA